MNLLARPFEFMGPLIIAASYLCRLIVNAEKFLSQNELAGLVSSTIQALYVRYSPFRLVAKVKSRSAFSRHDEQCLHKKPYRAHVL